MSQRDYCEPCGVQGKPLLAVAKLGDGTPVCFGHQTKAELERKPVTELQKPNGQAKLAPGLKLCKCGCGHSASLGRDYAWGHKQRQGKLLANVPVKPKAAGTVRVVSAKIPAELITLQMELRGKLDAVNKVIKLFADE